MKDRFGWFSVFALLLYLLSSISSCTATHSYGIMKPLDKSPWLDCQTQKTMGEKCQTYPYWKKLYRSKLA